METGGERELVPGDVLMVARRMRDKKTSKPYTWRFFMVVQEHDDWQVTGFVVGSERFKDTPFQIAIDDDKSVVQYLAPEEWPEGVLAFRMSMILRGVIEII